jgi:hypothetical protein
MMQQAKLGYSADPGWGGCRQTALPTAFIIELINRTSILSTMGDS